MLPHTLFLLRKKGFFSPVWNRYRPPRIKDTPGLDYGGGRADLYRRPHTGKLPVIIYLHGGCGAPMGRQHRRGICRALAEFGCAVLCPDITKNNITAQLHKVVSLAEWAKRNAQNYALDADRIIFAGDGAGAFLAFAMCRALTDAEYARRAGFQKSLPVPAGAVLFSGICDFSNIPEKGAVSRFYKRLAKAVFHIDGIEDMRTSPLFTLSKAGLNSSFPPVFFAHSRGDVYCRGQGENLRKALESAGVPYWEFFAADSLSPHIWNLNPAKEEACACNTAAGDFIEKIKYGNPGYARYDI